MPAISSQPRPQTFRGDDARLELRDGGRGRCCFRQGDRGRSSGCCERAGENRFYGGYRGYFADPDGHVWEVVQAPGFSFYRRRAGDPAGLARFSPPFSGGTSFHLT